ncbi:MAG: hypothetical protein KME17_19315 [Cyanosarcina radialis HA8281-LM2]|nr:hypothetical protein [Cyanosarcina radialis HA8281-LM2]
MNDCPFCSEPLLRHVRSGSLYWYCCRCRQAMPILKSNPAVKTSNSALK